MKTPLTMNNYMLIFKIIKLIQSDGGIWPFEVQQPAGSMQGATSNKMSPFWKIR